MINVTHEENYLEKINTYWNSLKSQKNIRFYEDKISDEKKKIIINGIKDDLNYSLKEK